MLQTAEIFQSGMMLQREKPITVWGTAKPNAQVTVEIQGQSAQAKADESGAWSVSVPALVASASETMTVKAGDEALVYEDVAVGEVWLAGGQSNMEFAMRYEKHKAEALENCEDARVRFYDVPEVCYDGQREEFDYSRMAVWRKATKEDLDYFSAVGYYFQKELEKTLDVPVGIVGCNWGGTTASVWMSRETLERVGEPWIRWFEQKCEGRDMEAYWKEQHGNPTNDQGNPFNQFSEMIMPRTLSDEEVKRFFGAMQANAPEGIDIAEMMANMLDAKTFPSCLYEHMVKTIAPYGVRGILWYQGESDDDVPGMNVLYKDMLTGVIGDWRALWGEELPFLFVQLPGYERWLMNTQKNHYPVIRKCQEDVAKTVKGTHLCSIADVGEEFDIHPKDKKTVGERLSLLARHYVYGEDILCDAPVAKEALRDGRQITITFENAGAGLHIKGEELSAMRVMVEDGSAFFNGEDEAEAEGVAFTAKVDGDKLVLTLKEETDKKVKVAFARTSWYLVNLYNEADIPAIPFEFKL